MERLTKRSNKTSHENGVCCTHFGSKECFEVCGNCAYGCKWEEETWSKLATYEDLEEQGLLLRLPSFEAWVILNAKTNYPTILSIAIDGLKLYEIDEMVNGKSKYYFRTKEEAEQALAKMKEGE